jgi:hypothetical protein
MGCAPGLVFGSTGGGGSLFLVLRSRTHFSAERRVSSPIFMFCSPRIVFGGSKGVGILFHVLRCRTLFRRYRGRRVPFPCFALPKSFSAVPRPSGPIFLFCARRIIFGGAECVGSHFHVFRSRTLFRRYRRRRIPFSCFALPYSFSLVPRASGPVFMVCAPGLIFGGTEGVGSRFHVLRSRNRF